MPADTPNKPSYAAIGAGVGLLSLALMSTEIVLTRLFSVVLWYHFAFFAVSIALLGLGAGAVIVRTLGGRLVAEAAPVQLAASALVASASMLGLAAGMLRATPDWFGTGAEASFTVMTPKLLAIFVLTTVPFIAGGFGITLCFTRFGDAIDRLYALDLLGAGCACALVSPLLDAFGGPHALVACAVLAALAAPLFASARSSGRSRAVLTSLAVAAVLGLTGVGAARAGGLEVRMAKGLDLAVAKPELQRWNSFSLVSVFSFWPFRGWGMSPAYTGPVPPQKGLVIDMNAFTPLTPFAGDFAAVEHTRHDLSAFVFQLQGATSKACIIGAGGGKDVLAALASGFEHVTGVEVNAIIVDDVMRGAYRAYTGGLYDRPDVDVHVEDGRSYVRGTAQRYDVILVSMVDTSAATAAGAFALAENALYTSDAFEDFLSRLRPGGMLTVSSVSLPGLAVGARLASLARAALLARGAAVSNAVAVVETPWLGVAGAGATMFNFVIKPDGFNASERATLAATATRLRFGATYLPGRTPPRQAGERAWITRILTEPSASRLALAMAGWPLDVSAVSDDRPFFFYQNRLREALPMLLARGTPHLFGNGLLVLIKVLVAALLMLTLLIVLPMYLARRSVGAASSRAATASAHLSTDLAYVACVGLGFMFLEIGLIQRLLSYLGRPTYALTAVLFVLLVGGGVGSRASSALSARGVRRALLLLLGYAALLTWVTALILNAAVALTPAVRAVLAALLLLPLGVLLGVPLPSALSRVRTRHEDRIAWLWAVNSCASVLGSILATLVSMHLGISASLGLGVVLYAAATALWGRVSA